LLSFEIITEVADTDPPFFGQVQISGQPDIIGGQPENIPVPRRIPHKLYFMRHPEIIKKIIPGTLSAGGLIIILRLRISGSCKKFSYLTDGHITAESCTQSVEPEQSLPRRQIKFIDPTILIIHRIRIQLGRKPEIGDPLEKTGICIEVDHRKFQRICSWIIGS